MSLPLEHRAVGALSHMAKQLERSADVMEKMLERIDGIAGGVARGEDAVAPVIKAADNLKHQVEWALNDLAYTAPEDSSRQTRAYAVAREALAAYTEARSALK